MSDTHQFPPGGAGLIHSASGNRSNGLVGLESLLSTSNGATGDSIGEVRHVAFLSEDIGSLYLNDSYSDIVLVVNDTRFQAHKVILAARSEYFR